MTANRSQYVIVNRAGPTWDLAPLEELARVLGQRYKGEIWTFGDDPIEIQVGTFQIHRDRHPLDSGLAKKLARVIRLIGRGLALRLVHRRRLIVITYDPLTAGIVGVGLRWLAGARFVCEVNGAYDNAANFADIQNPTDGATKTRRAIVFGSWVLRQAHHIKLLFCQQIDGFSVPSDIPRSVLMDFVDWSKFQYTNRPREPILLFVGYPFLLKGVDILLEAFSRVRSDFPHWRLVLIGFQIPEQARARGLPTDGVTLLGPQPPEEVSRWMERTRALILPSRTEAMGRVLIEAAFKGCPRIGSRVGGIPHYVTHEVDGLLFEPGNIDDLSATLRRFMGDETLQARLGDAARARAEREFTAERYLELYSRIIDGLAGK